MTGASFHHEAMAHQEKAQLNVIITVAACLARRGTARVARQSCTIGPSWGWLSSQRSQRSEPREKHHAASNTNGVVGSSGKKMPMKPVSSASQPATSHKGRSQRVRVREALEEDLGRDMPQIVPTSPCRTIATLFP